jgi:hypothetical protein
VSNRKHIVNFSSTLPDQIFPTSTDKILLDEGIFPGCQEGGNTEKFLESLPSFKLTTDNAKLRPALRPDATLLRSTESRHTIPAAAVSASLSLGQDGCARFDVSSILAAVNGLGVAIEREALARTLGTTLPSVPANNACTNILG